MNIDQIVREAEETIKQRFKIDTVAALHLSLNSIIRYAIEKAVQEYDDRICNHVMAMIGRTNKGR